jgi:hypothetical protein
LLYCTEVGTVILWGALVGAWLLFLGAIYQAALELGSHVIARDRIQAAAKQVPQPPRVSAWWWLVPPVKIAREAQRSRTWHVQYAMLISVEDVESLVKFQDKGMGWSCVAVGAWLLAVNQTLTLVRELGWSDLVLVLASVAATVVSVTLCVVRVRHSKRLLHMRRTETLR